MLKFYVKIFQLAGTKSRKSYCTTPGVGVGVGVGGGVGVSKKFHVKVFYVLGRALSGELSCPCDRSCYVMGKALSGNLSCKRTDLSQYTLFIRL